MVDEIKQTELAYIAGIIDGEGCIYTKYHRNKDNSVYYDVGVQIEMTDNTALLLIQQCFGWSIYIRTRKGHKSHKPLYHLQLIGSQALTLLRAIKPFILLKSGQADIAIRLESHKKWQRYTDMERFLQEADATAIKVLNRRGITEET